MDKTGCVLYRSTRLPGAMISRGSVSVRRWRSCTCQQRCHILEIYDLKDIWHVCKNNTLASVQTADSAMFCSKTLHPDNYMDAD